MSPFKLPEQSNTESNTKDKWGTVNGSGYLKYTTLKTEKSKDIQSFFIQQVDDGTDTQKNRIHR